MPALASWFLPLLASKSAHLILSCFSNAMGTMRATAQSYCEHSNNTPPTGFGLVSLWWYWSWVIGVVIPPLPQQETEAFSVSTLKQLITRSPTYGIPSLLISWVITFTDNKSFPNGCTILFSIFIFFSSKKRELPQAVQHRCLRSWGLRGMRRRTTSGRQLLGDQSGWSSWVSQ